MPPKKPLSKASAKKPAKKKVASKARAKPVAKRTMTAKTVKKTVAAKAPAKASAAKKTPAKKSPAKASIAFAKTNRPITPMRERPLSPHLGIYRPQITSMLSILHRGTGVVLYLGAFILAWLVVALGYGEHPFTASLALIDNQIGFIILYGCIFCLFYHLCNGIRHLAWDIGEGFELNTVTLSGAFVLMMSISLTLAIWLIIHPQFLQQYLR